MITRVTGTLILPYEVHTTTIGTEVCAQFTLVDVCLETKSGEKHKCPNVTERQVQQPTSHKWAEEFLLTNARGDVWGQLVTRRALTAITSLCVVANASSAQERISLAFVNICKMEKTPR